MGRRICHNRRWSTITVRRRFGPHDCIRLLELITTRHNQGPIDRRWEIPNAIVARAVPRRFFRDELDSAVTPVTLAIRYLKLRARRRLGSDRWLGYLDQAFRLRFHADKLTRATLEARLLSGEPIGEKAGKPASLSTAHRSDPP
jgi:hypothetical protein